MPDMINETVKVRFGMSSTRELEIEVEPGHNIATEFETALNGGAELLWVTDNRGYQHAIVLDKVAFVEIETASHRDIGFS
jgi:hypothetical protein